MSILSKLKPPAGSKKSKVRVGRGVGSTLGKTAGRGQKGQGARSGSGGMLFFEGGQTPLYRRLPKRGFKNVNAARVVNVNVGQLDAFDDGTVVDAALLQEVGLIKGRYDHVKVLGDGDLAKKLTVQAHAFSKGAAAKIEAAGGTAEVVSRSPEAEASPEEAAAAKEASADDASA